MSLTSFLCFSRFFLPLGIPNAPKPAIKANQAKPAAVDRAGLPGGTGFDFNTDFMAASAAALLLAASLTAACFAAVSYIAPVITFPPSCSAATGANALVAKTGLATCTEAFAISAATAAGLATCTEAFAISAATPAFEAPVTAPYNFLALAIIFGANLYAVYPVIAAPARSGAVDPVPEPPPVDVLVVVEGVTVGVPVCPAAFNSSRLTVPGINSLKEYWAG